MSKSAYIKELRKSEKREFKDGSSRCKELEAAVRDLLTLKNIKFMRVDNYRCFKCGQVQNKKATGWPDFFCYKPLFAIECKTGAGKLTDEQIEIKECLEFAGVKYILLRNNLDELIEHLK